MKNALTAVVMSKNAKRDTQRHVGGTCNMADANSLTVPTCMKRNNLKLTLKPKLKNLKKR